MPPGVEHYVEPLRVDDELVLIFVSMPPGVEHEFAAEVAAVVAPDLRLDASGR